MARPLLCSIESLVPWRSTRWEGAVFSAIEALSGKRSLRLVRSDEHLPDLVFVLYPAEAHDQIVAGGKVSLLVSQRLLHNGRVGFCACDRSDPEVSEDQVWSLVATQAPTIRNPMICRAPAVEVLDEAALEWIDLAARELALTMASDTGTTTEDKDEEWVNPRLTL